MNWLIFVFITTISDSLNIFIDNYISDFYFKGREANAQKYFYGFTAIIIGALTLVFSGFNFSQLGLPQIGIFLLSGVIAGVAGIPYFKALEIDDSTNLGIFIQLTPILYLIFGWLFLHESFSFVQLLAFVAILAAPIYIVASSRKRSRKVQIMAVLFALLYVFLDVTGNLIFVSAHNESINLFHAIGLLKIGKGITNLMIVHLYPKWRRRFRTVYKQSRGRVIRPMIINSCISLVTDFTYRAALIAAPAVAIASATSDSIEPIVIFFMGIVLTLIWPKFGREKLNRKNVLTHLVATALVVVGIVLLQI